MYTLLKHAIPLNPGIVSRLKRHGLKHARRIFNPDRKRLQSDLPDTQYAAHIRHQVHTILCRTKLLYPTHHVLTNGKLLVSRAGCARQDWHRDYPNELYKTSPVRPAGVLLALEPGTTLDIQLAGQDKQLTLEPGDLLIFDGDLVHAGSAYARQNVRIHFYIDVQGIHRPLTLERPSATN